MQRFLNHACVSAATAAHILTATPGHQMNPRLPQLVTKTGKKPLVKKRATLTNIGHQVAEEKAVNLLKIREPGKDVAFSLQRQRSKEQLQVKKGILSVIDVVILLGQRGIGTTRRRRKLFLFCKLEVTI